MRNVILINIEPFTPNRDRLFLISQLREDGFNVRVWSLLFLSKRGIDFPDVVKADYVDVLNSHKDVKKNLDNTDCLDTFFIVQVPFHNEALPLYRELKKRNCFIACFNFYTNTFDVPDYHVKLTPSIKDPMLIFRQMCRKVSNYLTWRIHQYLWRNIHYDCYLSPLSGSLETGHLNHPDYNDFKFGSSDKYLDYPYVVFCDNYFPYHPDLVGHVDSIDGNKYQKQITELFDCIEQKTGLPVVIAAHPKALYENNEFGGRLIVKYKTNNLVTHSCGVIFHTSNSISYAIMANKKVLCVTSDDYNSVNNFEKYIHYLCKYFGIKSHNLDHEDFSSMGFEPISEEIREKYIYSFLTHKDCENKDNYSIIKETIINAKMI